MAQFTVSIRELIEDGWEFPLDKYPVFDEVYREKLNTKIKNHYMFYEIGSETRDQFGFFLSTRMAEIMPFYNKLYESEKMIHDPLSTMNYSYETNSVNESDSKTDVNGLTKSQNDTSSTARNVASDFPQMMLSENGDYATNASDVQSKAGATSSATEASAASGVQKGSAKVTHKVTGSQGVAANILQAYRAALLNIDMMIIAELRDLFLYITDTGATDFDGGFNRGTHYGYRFLGF